MPRRQKTAGFDLGAWLSGHGIAVRAEKPWQGGRLFVLEECPFSSAHKDGAFAIQFSSGAVFAGCHHQVAAAGRKAGRPPEALREGGTPEPDTGRGPRILGGDMGFILTRSTAARGDRTVAGLASRSSRDRLQHKRPPRRLSGTPEGEEPRMPDDAQPRPGGLKDEGTVSDGRSTTEGLLPGIILLTITLSRPQEILRSATGFRELSSTDAQYERRFRVPYRKVRLVACKGRDRGYQVRNCMLTVWIDDSAAQDRQCLEHMKMVEAGRCRRRRMTRPSSPAGRYGRCWARRFWVSDPVCAAGVFLVAANRRNPGMLLTLSSATPGSSSCSAAATRTALSWRRR